MHYSHTMGWISGLLLLRVIHLHIRSIYHVHSFYIWVLETYRYKGLDV